MIITVLMAGYDSNAQKKSMTVYLKQQELLKVLKIPNLMGWVVADSKKKHKVIFDSATDGDLDIAYSLLLAHKQWGSNGTVNYLKEAQDMITKRY